MRRTSNKPIVSALARLHKPTSVCASTYLNDKLNEIPSILLSLPIVCGPRRTTTVIQHHISVYLHYKHWLCVLEIIGAPPVFLKILKKK